MDWVDFAFAQNWIEQFITERKAQFREDSLMQLIDREDGYDYVDYGLVWADTSQGASVWLNRDDEMNLIHDGTFRPGLIS